MCDVAKIHGARVDQRCGGHVHINMEKLDTARQRWRRFFKTIEVYEDCIYRARKSKKQCQTLCHSI
ncbi:amidoligase family protein [Clostridium perfringens]|uniref:amidoligase family protein n=1 Tax=Clostridium perfringens TaxID=1502 RepID=UPI0024BCB44E|nr:amidoligase family protein [Clostridium perfringens]MDT9337662.1 amidoligase family protein [Clostridium perfringens]MDT9345419.1 amidoligase family protein [Clostridium perfringens]MDT9348662.1 amidoligase family protein [Clostridium perfringens]MDT9354505.1 amidoligase family protein [Clostridium perfringens]